MPWTGEPCFYVAMIREHICLPRLVKNGFISTQAQEALMIFDVSKMQCHVKPTHLLCLGAMAHLLLNFCQGLTLE